MSTKARPTAQPALQHTAPPPEVLAVQGRAAPRASGNAVNYYPVSGSVTGHSHIKNWELGRRCARKRPHRDTSGLGAIKTLS